MTTKPGPTNVCIRSHFTWFLQDNLQYRKPQNYAWQHFNITAITFVDKLYFYWLVPFIPLIFRWFCSLLKRPPALENQFPIASLPAERRQNLFSRTDRLILMTWLNMLSIVVSAASKGKLEILERKFYKSGALTRLLYCSNHGPWLPTITTDHYPSDTNASWTITIEPWCNYNFAP